MSKDKKNKSVKTELNSALNSNYSYDEDMEDLPFAFAKNNSHENNGEDVVNFSQISVTASNSDVSDDDSDMHIQVIFGESIESNNAEKEEPKETSKETLASKTMLKKNNGTAVSRMIKDDKPSKEQRKTVFFGVIISILVFIGAVSTVSTITNTTKNFINSTSLKSELTNVVFPMVIIDIPEFETSTNLDSSVIISTAIWAFVTDTEKDMNKYQQDDLGSIYVPDVDIELYVRKLYGSDIEINHQTINNSSIQMIYNEQEKMYIIESSPSFLPYTPRIDEVKRTGSIYTLTVSYILPTVSWSLNSYDIEAEEADKIMEYRLQKVNDNYHFLSVRLLAINNHSTSTNNDRTEYIGNYNDYIYDDSEVLPQLLPDDLIASDILAEEAKKAEELDDLQEGDDDNEEDDDTDDDSGDTADDSSSTS